MESERLQMTVGCMRVTCLISKATNKHSEYVILRVHCHSRCTNWTQCYVVLYCLSCLANVGVLAVLHLENLHILHFSPVFMEIMK